jgi:hypothetical protein
MVEGEPKTLFPFAEDSHYRDLLSDLLSDLGIIPPLNLTNAARSLCAAAATTHADRAHAAVVQPMLKSIDPMANTVSLISSLSL